MMLIAATYFLLSLCAGAQFVQGASRNGVAHCSSGKELADALESPDVDVAFVSADIRLSDGDFDGHTLPILLNRNMTISGSQNAPFIFDFNAVLAKAQLGSGVILTMRWLVLLNWKKSIQARDVSLFVSAVNLTNQAAASAFVLPIVRLKEAYLLQDINLPMSYAILWSNTSTRPAELGGGVQRFQIPVAPPTSPTECSNSSDAPPLRRCIAYAMLYVDYGWYALTVLPGDLPASRGYLLHFVDTVYMVVRTYPEDCVARLGPLGCSLSFNSTGGGAGNGSTGDRPPPASPSPLALQPSETASTNKHLLPAVLGGVLGGVAAALGLLLIVWYLHSRRRRKPLSHIQSPQRADFQAKSCAPEVMVATTTVAPSNAPSSKAGSFSAGIFPYMLSSSLDTSSDILVTPSTQHRHGLILNVRITAAGQQVTAGSTSREASFLAACGSSATGSATVTPSVDDTVALLPQFLGRGAFGSVYVGVYRGTRVAVKVISLDGQGLPRSGRSVTSPSPQLAGEDSEQYNQQHQEQQQQQQQQQLGQSNKHKPRHTQHPPSDELLAAGDHHTPACGSAVGQAARMVLPLPRPVSPDEGAHMQGSGSIERQEQGTGLTQPQRLSGCQGTAGGTQTASGACLVKVGSGSNVHSGGGSRGRHGGGVSSSGRSGAARWSRSSSPVQHSGAARWTNGDDGSSFAFQGVPTIFEEQMKMEELQARQAERDAEQQATRQAAMLVQEVEVLGRCTHPNVVQLLAACVTPPRFCLVLELMETSLQHLIYSRPGVLLPLPTVLHIAAQICQGLAYLHPTIVHRDLKPPNVLLSGTDGPWPVAKLADFGLSRIRFETVPTLRPQAGTPAYLAPECLDTTNNLVTHRADIYSLGILFWSMLTGQEPWKGLQLLVLACKVAAGERPSLEALSDVRCPPRLRRLIAWCWEQDPQRRPAAAEALVEVQQMLELQVEENGQL